MSTESSVINRYGSAAINHEQNLCCPVEYDTNGVAAIQEQWKEMNL